MSAQLATNSLSPHIAFAQSTDDLLSDVDLLIRKTIAYSCEKVTDQENICFTAASYHLAAKSHKIRARLALNAGMALGVHQQDVVMIAAACELLHNASLIHDDIQDGDTLRRNIETVWKKFGVNVALCTGDLLLSAAYGVLSNISDATLIQQLITTIHQRTARVIQGQCADIAHKNQPLCTLGAYQKIAISKSGALLSLPIELALLASHHTESLSNARAATESFAIAYQIADDLCDIDKDAQSQSLNVISVLKACGETKQPIQVAQNLAMRHLDEAIYLAAKLPKESGALLNELALQLKLKLSN